MPCASGTAAPVTAMRKPEPEIDALQAKICHRAEIKDDLAKLIVLAVIFPLLTIAVMGAAEWARGL